MMAKRTKVEVTKAHKKYVAKTKTLATKYTARIGILEGATNQETGELIAPYAFDNEFGTVNIPSRPFLRLTWFDKYPSWLNIIKRPLLRREVTSKDIERAFFVMAQIGIDDVRETIRMGVPPPNAESTVAAKMERGNAEPDKTLVWTGSMFAAINADVNRRRVRD